jgi:hypothetical protein
LVTRTFNGVAVEPEIPAVVGADEAVSITEPRFEGFQVQVAVKVETEPVANLFLHPGNTFPFKLKVTFAATFIVAEITTADL